MRKVFTSWALSLLLFLPLIGCASPPADDNTPGAANQKANSEAVSTQSEAPQPTQAPRYSGPIEFVDITAQSGLNFKHNSGAFGKKYMPETVGSGCAFLDYDN